MFMQVGIYLVCLMYQLPRKDIKANEWLGSSNMAFTYDLFLVSSFWLCIGLNPILLSAHP